jgi:hypothetical protein
MNSSVVAVYNLRAIPVAGALGAAFIASCASHSEAATESSATVRDRRYNN